MIGTAIELTLTCPRCNNPAHVNALVSTLVCSSCEHSLEIPMDWWEELLENVFDEIPDYAPGRGGRSQAFAGERPASNILYARWEPYCYDCKTPFDMDAAQLSQTVGCSKCGKAWSSRPPTEAFRQQFPTVSRLLAEDANLVSGGSGKAPVGSEPVVFSCPSCSGALSVDGSERVVPCNFCGSEVFLPDELWRRMHPVSTIQRWFVWWDDGDHVRDPSRFPTPEEEELEQSTEQESSAFADSIADVADSEDPYDEDTEDEATDVVARPRQRARIIIPLMIVAGGVALMGALLVVGLIAFKMQ